MSYNINSTFKKVLSQHGKVKALIEDENAIRLQFPPKSLIELPQDQGLVCVTHNAAFETASFIVDDKQLRIFNDVNDERRKTWLMMDLQKCKDLSGYNQ